VSNKHEHNAREHQNTEWNDKRTLTTVSKRCDYILLAVTSLDVLPFLFRHIDTWHVYQRCVWTANIWTAEKDNNTKLWPPVYYSGPDCFIECLLYLKSIL